MKYDVPNRFSGDVQFTADIDCDENASDSVKKRISVLWAIENEANLSEANLSGVNLRGAYLSDAYLSGAYLRWAKGIYSFGPVGEEGRICYAVKHENCTMIKLGCFWGTEKEALEAIENKYGKNSTYAAQAKLAVKILNQNKLKD